MRKLINYIQKCPKCGNWGEDIFEIQDRTLFNPATKCKRCEEFLEEHYSKYSKIIVIEAKDRKMTPQEFEKEMKLIYNNFDIEDAHKHMDNLMCELLRTFGDKEGIKIFEEQEKWYS